METVQLRSPKDVKRFFDVQREDIKREISEETQKIVAEMVESEIDLLEFNLFLSSSGKEHMDRATNAVKEMRRLKDEGKLDLTEYEELAEEF